MVKLPCKIAPPLLSILKLQAKDLGNCRLGAGLDVTIITQHVVSKYGCYFFIGLIISLYDYITPPLCNVKFISCSFFQATFIIFNLLYSYKIKKNKKKKGEETLLTSELSLAVFTNTFLTFKIFHLGVSNSDFYRKCQFYP